MKGNRLQALVYSLIIFLLLPVASCLSPVYAADSTPSADIKSKLDELKKEIASKAAALRSEVDKKLTNKAYVGKIKTKSASALTLATINGPRIVTLTQDTQFVSQLKGKKYSQKLISEEDYVASLGDIDENQVLVAKQLILLPAPTQEKTFLWSQIVSISDKLITLKDRTQKTISVSLPNNRIVKATDFVILTGNLDKNQIFQAGFVYVIPQGGFIIKPKKIATPSATLATSSAKKK